MAMVRIFRVRTKNILYNLETIKLNREFGLVFYVVGLVEFTNRLAPYKGKCYSIFETPLPWHLAEIAYETIGAQLVNIESAVEMRFVNKLLFFRANKTYWTAGTDQEVVSVFQ